MDHKGYYQRLEVWVRANLRAWPELSLKTDWLRSARVAQSIKGRELAERLGVSPARVSMMERDEEKGTLTLNSMRKAAEALDCELVYLLIPKKSLKTPSMLSDQKPRMKVVP